MVNRSKIKISKFALRIHFQDTPTQSSLGEGYAKVKIISKLKPKWRLYIPHEEKRFIDDALSFFTT